MSRALFILLTGLLPIFGAACSQPPPPAISWTAEPAPGRPILYKFATAWCPYCARLDETVFSDPRVIALAREFSTVYVDGDRSASDALIKKYEVKGYPTIIFTRPDGSAIVTTNDDPDPDHFLTLMQIALGRTDPARKIALDAAQKEAELPLTYLDKGKATKNPNEQRRIWEEGLSLCQDYLRTPSETSITRYEMAPDYIDAEVELYQALGRPEAAARARRDGALLLLNRIKAAPQPAVVKSLFSPAILLLTDSGFYREARKLAGSAINAFPREPLYHRRLAEVYVASLEGDYSRERVVKKALHEYGLAMRYGYGRNLLKTADGYSDLLVKLGKTDETREVIQTAIAAVDWSTNTRKKELALKTKLETKLH